MSSDQIKPFLNFVLIFAVGICSFSFRGEEDVEIEFVEFAVHGHLFDAVRHLIGHQNHSRQRKIWVIGTFPILFGSLLIGIGPVVNLVFDEFSAVDGSEWGSGKEEIIIGRDRKEGFVVRITGIIVLVFAFLVSPLGLPMLAAWTIGQMQRFRYFVQDAVYG